MRILSEYLLMGPLDGVGGGTPPPPGSGSVEGGGPPPSGTGTEGAPPAGGPPTGGAIDGELSGAEAMEIFNEELGEAQDFGNLGMNNETAAGLMNQIRNVVSQQKIAQAGADQGLNESIEHHHTETGEAHHEVDTFTREMEGRTAFRTEVRAALESGDRGAVERAFQERFGSGAFANAKANKSGGETGADTRPRDPATPNKPGTTPNPTGSGTPTKTETPTRPVIHMAKLNPQQQDMVNRFRALRNEARSLRQQAEGMPEGPERNALMARAENMSEEGNGLQALLAADGINLSEDAEIREEGEEGAEEAGEGGGTEGGEGVDGLASHERVGTVGEHGETGSGAGGDGEGPPTGEAERPTLTEVGSRLFVSFGGESDRDVGGARAASLLRTMHKGATDVVSDRAVRMYYGHDERDSEGGGRGGSGDDSNPLDASAVHEMPGWSVDTVDGGLGGRTIIRGPDGRIYDRNEVAAARDIRLGRRDADEATPRMNPLMDLPVGQLDSLLFGPTTIGSGRGGGGSDSVATLGHGARFDTLTARCMAISARSDDSRFASSNPGHYERGWFA